MSVSSITANAPALGDVASAASGITLFRVTAASGAIVRVSGAGARISTGSSLTTVTVACGEQDSCNKTNANIKIGNIGTPAGRAGALGNFTVAMGSATLVSDIDGTDPIAFTIGAIGKNSTATFYVGMDLPISGDDSGKATGAAISGFYVYIAPSRTTPNSGSTSGRATATVRRPITVSKSSDLNFGTVIRPRSGSGTVSIDAATGARSFTGGAINTPNTTSARAVYTIGGEGGQAFSITVPQTFAMTLGSDSLTVTTSATAAGAHVLSSSLGSAGTFGFGVGGTLPVTNTTVTGAYSGSFNVTVNYN